MTRCTQLLQQRSTHTPFNSPLSRTTRVSWYQKGKTNLDFTEARDSEWQWHQLGHMQVCTLLHTDNHASTPPLPFFTGRMPFLPPNQQRQTTEGRTKINMLQKMLYMISSRSLADGISLLVGKAKVVYRSLISVAEKVKWICLLT